MRVLTNVLIIGILALGTLACTMPHGNSPGFGDSVRNIVQAQKLNPHAGGDAPVLGLDGRYAHDSLNNYRDTVGTPAPDTGLGTSDSGGGL